MGEVYKPHFETDEEIEKTAVEAVEVLKSYHKSVTEQQEPDDGSVKISENEVKPGDLEKAKDEASDAIENLDKKDT